MKENIKIHKISSKQSEEYRDIEERIEKEIRAKTKLSDRELRLDRQNKLVDNPK